MFSPSLTVRPALRTWAVCCVLFAGTVLLFLRAADYGFSNYDDPRYVADNPHVQAGFSHAAVTYAFTAPEANWHPLTWFSHMLDWQLYGNNAGGHHLTSVGWHALNAALLFFLLRRLTSSFWTSAFAAALFAWHPLRVESVAWISERKDVLSGFFFIVTLLAYTAYVGRRTSQRPAMKFYLLTLVLFAGGLMSKPMVVSLPVILLVLDFWPLGRLPVASRTPGLDRLVAPWPAWRSLIVEKIPFFALSVASSAVAFVMQRDSGAFTLTLPFDARLLNAIVAVVRYLGKFFWPSNLAICYPHPGYWPTVVVIASALLLIGLTTAAWLQRMNRPWLLAGWAWFVIMLLPTLGLIQVGFQSMADRYTYLPVLGIQLALLWSLRELSLHLRPRWLVTLLGGLVLGGCIARTWNQEATWRDPITMFEHAVAVTDNNDVAEGFIGYTHLGLGHNDEAARHAQRALDLNPKNENALYTLATVRQRQGQWADAAGYCRALLQLNPRDAKTEFFLGVILLRQGQTDEAIGHMKSAATGHAELYEANLRIATTEAALGRPQNSIAHYEVAVALNPTDADVQYGYGFALAALGRMDEALAHYQTALQLQPDHAAAHTEVGLIFFQRHQLDEAIGHFHAALGSQPKSGIAHLGLARALEQLGRSAEATASFAQAMICAPNNPTAFSAWADTLARRGQFADAVAPYELAVQLRPNDAGIHAGLGFVLFLSNRRAEAVREWEEALRLNPNFPGLRERLERARQDLER